MLKEKEYLYFKTAKKTANANNLIVANETTNKPIKRLFDFSFLEDVCISEKEKEIIKNDALKHIYASNKISFYGCLFDAFEACDGIAEYYLHRVYTNNGTKHCYDIYELANLKHYHKERKSIYETNYQVTTYECSPIYRKPINDIDL